MGAVSSSSGFDVDACGVTARTNGAWFQYRPSGNLVLTTAELTDQSFMSQITMFTGSCDELKCNTLVDGTSLGQFFVGFRHINFVAEAGETYYILLAELLPNSNITYGLNITVSIQAENVENKSK
jgi:hypothetical protein